MEKAIAVILGALILVFLAAGSTTLLWYTFDDLLAYRTGVTWLGNIPFFNMLGATFFVKALLSAAKAKVSNND
jgi:hypothetical protein